MYFEISWNPNPANEQISQYKVYHGADASVPSFFTSIPAANPTSVSFPPQALGYAEGQTVYVGISAVGPAGEGPKSVVNFVVPVSIPPASAPSGVVATLVP